jgi:hypothetical protein
VLDQCEKESHDNETVQAPYWLTALVRALTEANKIPSNIREHFMITFLQFEACAVYRMCKCHPELMRNLMDTINKYEERGADYDITAIK